MYTCIICLLNTPIRWSGIIAHSCNYCYCYNMLCIECIKLTDRINKISTCSINCLLNKIETHLDYYSNFMTSKREEEYINNAMSDCGHSIQNDQIEIYEDIMIENRFTEVVKIYPNVLAKIISEY